MPPGMGESVIKDFRVWHTYEGAIYNYPAHRMTVDGLVYRIDPAATLYWPSAFQCGDYRNVDITIRNGSIHAGGVFGGCTIRSARFRFESVDAVTREQAFSFETPATPGTGADRPASGVTMIAAKQPHRAVARAVAADDRDEPQPLARQFAARRSVRSLRLRLSGAGRATTSASTSSEQATQNLYGGLAPCTNTTPRPEIDGITCTGGFPPLAPTGFRIVR